MDRLREFSIVTMSLPDLGRVSEFKAHVLGVHRSVATLQPAERMDSLWLPPLVEGVLMSFSHGSQTVGLKGDLRCERPDTIQFRVTDGVCVPRRRSSRLKLCAPATVVPLGPDGRAQRDEIPCQTQDVGPDGVLLEGANGLRPDQLTAFTLILPEDPEPVYARAQVTAIQDGVASLEFVAIDRDVRRRLSGFVTEELRRRLNIVRSLQEEEDDGWD
jgi:PilZ domain-containing protein